MLAVSEASEPNASLGGCLQLEAELSLFLLARIKRRIEKLLLLL